MHKNQIINLGNNNSLNDNDNDNDDDDNNEYPSVPMIDTTEKKKKQRRPTKVHIRDEIEKDANAERVKSLRMSDPDRL